MSTAYDQRQRYRLYLAPDRGPIIAVELDGQRVSAARMMSDDLAVDEIIVQIRRDSHSRDETSGLQFDDLRARSNLKSILSHMQTIHHVAGMVVYIPGTTLAGPSDGSATTSGPAPDEIQRIEDAWRKKVDALTRQQEQDVEYLQRDHKEALEETRRQAQTQLDSARHRIHGLEAERDQAIKRAVQLEADLKLAQVSGRQGSEELEAEVIRLNGVVTERERQIAGLTADLQAATAREENVRGKERRAREEARMLHERIARMKEDERKRQSNNMQELAGGRSDLYVEGL